MTANIKRTHVMKEYKFDFKGTSELREFIFTHDFYGYDSSDETIEGHLSNFRKVYYGLLDDYSALINAADYLKKEWNVDVSDRYYLLTSYLSAKIERFKQYYDLCHDIIEDKKAKCKHEYHEDGHDSHHTYYLCNKCGQEDKV